MIFNPEFRSIICRRASLNIYIIFVVFNVHYQHARESAVHDQRLRVRFVLLLAKKYQRHKLSIRWILQFQLQQAGNVGMPNV